MKKESNKNWTTCLRLNTGDGSPRVFLLNSHFLGSVPKLHFAFLFSFNLRTHFSSASYLKGHLTQKAPYSFLAKRTKQDTKSSMDSIVGTITSAFNVNYCRWEIRFLAAV